MVNPSPPSHVSHPTDPRTGSSRHLWAFLYLQNDIGDLREPYSSLFLICVLFDKVLVSVPKLSFCPSFISFPFFFPSFLLLLLSFSLLLFLFIYVFTTQPKIPLPLLLQVPPPTSSLLSPIHSSVSLQIQAGLPMNISQSWIIKLQ